MAVVNCKRCGKSVPKEWVDAEGICVICAVRADQVEEVFTGATGGCSFEPRHSLAITRIEAILNAVSSRGLLTLKFGKHEMAVRWGAVGTLILILLKLLGLIPTV